MIREKLSSPSCSDTKSIYRQLGKRGAWKLFLRVGLELRHATKNDRMTFLSFAKGWSIGWTVPMQSFITTSFGSKRGIEA